MDVGMVKLSTGPENPGFSVRRLHIDKGSGQPVESSGNDRVTVLFPCHQASDHFYPGSQFREEVPWNQSWFPSL